jgi:UDP-GlcNAc:undecaprenyl-phosphate/decaprenyl-phosphate GlcNAc-1-phosphate transferase
LGIVLYINFLLISIFFLDLSYSKLIIILILWAVVAIVNFIDDLDTISKTIIKIPPIFRLILQILIGAVIWITSIKIGYISNIFWWILYLDHYYFVLWSIKIYIIPLVFTIAWYVLVFNSINWSDAVPWVTSGLSIIALLIIFILTVKLYFLDTSLVAKENSIFVLQILSILIPSILLLWIFDVKKKFLIWDSGTMFIAFMIATLAIVSGWKIATVASVLGIYLIDAFYVIFMRLYNKKNPLKWDMIHHLHFRLWKMWFSPNFIRWFVYSFSFLFWLWAIFFDKIWKIILFVILTIIIIFITKIVSFKRK